MDREQYEKDLKERQEKHLREIAGGGAPWSPCMHDACTECHGTGVKRFGGACIHGISCPCPKCSAFC